MMEIDPNARINDLPGLGIGHWTNREKTTGLTVALPFQRAVASIASIGAAPCLSDTALLEASMTVEKIDALILTGGSVFGLDAAAGARRYLEERRRGFKVGSARVPITPVASLFNLSVSSQAVRPAPRCAYLAARAAESNHDRRIGQIGAGAGARIAKYGAKKNIAPGGFASTMVTLENKISVGAMVALNSFGAVISERGDDRIQTDYICTPNSKTPFGSTIIGLVATDARLSKTDAKRIATMSLAGIARAVYPAFTPYDGDTLFAMSTGLARGRVDISRIGAVGAWLIERAIIDAARAERA